MNLQIQILSKHNKSQFYFTELINALSIEPITTIDNLTIYSSIYRSTIGQIINEILFICRQHCFSIEIDFDKTTCYLTIKD